MPDLCHNCRHPLDGHRERHRITCYQDEDRRRYCTDCPGCTDQREVAA